MEPMEAKVTATVIPIHMTDNALKQNPLRLNRLLQLCSANLPVGGFSFSQGLDELTSMLEVGCFTAVDGLICVDERLTSMYSNTCVTGRPPSKCSITSRVIVNSSLDEYAMVSL